ncbi:hypothetical protein SCB71_14605 [Herbiconiux sp. KACC 21604]|uniref:hypothetical protein n=1 Tax=unclassified Herbiconiux TaxID=2618217 RepID=UPI001490FEE6|nr:hypothetical protein [Herbiconiux sp. SALV-R1]QJU54373.1 hypothetical protein HL652_12545 [Herbiconiux sp. SALV-R1]WPO85444.1 hypothetical protein SCB71_14605 [Herbiconiux sp. KACC 21604]
MSAWNYGDDVVLQVAGKYSLAGKIVGNQTEDGRVTVRWEDRTMTQLRGDLLVTPAEAAAAPTWAEVETAALLTERDELREVLAGADHTAAKYWRKLGVALGERDRARDLAARLEAELAIAEAALEVAMGSAA